MKSRSYVVLAGGMGNVLEWYDFGLYGLLAPVLATLFFRATTAAPPYWVSTAVLRPASR